MNTRNSCVYKITDEKGNTLYIGRTSRKNVQKRFDEHMLDAKRLSLFRKKDLILGAFFD